MLRQSASSRADEAVVLSDGGGVSPAAADAASHRVVAGLAGCGLRSDA